MPTFDVPHRVVCGETTCATSPGNFCRYLGVRNFGTVPVCTLFGGISLFENEDGWVARCRECLDAEQVAEG